MNDADQLLLKWAQEKVKPWLEKQIKNYPPGRPSEYFYDRMYEMGYRIHGATLEHLLSCTPLVYGTPGHSWECGCYSEYTRDDSWMVHSYIRCAHGLMTEMRLAVSPWDMPEVIHQLAEMDEGCPYDDPDYAW